MYFFCIVSVHRLYFQQYRHISLLSYYSLTFHSTPLSESSSFVPEVFPLCPEVKASHHYPNRHLSRLSLFTHPSRASPALDPQTTTCSLGLYCDLGWAFSALICVHVVAAHCSTGVHPDSTRTSRSECGRLFRYEAARDGSFKYNTWWELRSWYD